MYNNIMRLRSSPSIRLTVSMRLPDRAMQDQKLFFDKHIPRLQQRLQQADDVDAIDADIRRILAERYVLASG